jgi:hypothetical protein
MMRPTAGRPAAAEYAPSRLAISLRIPLYDVIGRLGGLRTPTFLIRFAIAKLARGFLQTSSNGV